MAQLGEGLFICLTTRGFRQQATSLIRALCHPQQKRHFRRVLIVKLVRPSLSASARGLTTAGGHNSGSGRARLAGLESSWRCCSWIRTRPEEIKETRKFKPRRTRTQFFPISRKIQTCDYYSWISLVEGDEQQST